MAKRRVTKTRVKQLIKHGTVCPHPTWTKDEVLEHCRRMYHEVEALRSYIIDNGLVLVEKNV